jgi:flagellar protein FlaG
VFDVSVNPVEASSPIHPAAAAAPVPARSDPAAQKGEETVAERSVAPEEVRQMIAEIQEEIDTMNVSLSFSTYGEQGEYIAVIVADKETGEVIREIPAKEIQDLFRKMSELSGVIFNREV